jgi:hypothetical protein
MLLLQLLVARVRERSSSDEVGVKVCLRRQLFDFPLVSRVLKLDFSTSEHLMLLDR